MGAQEGPPRGLDRARTCLHSEGRGADPRTQAPCGGAGGVLSGQFPCSRDWLFLAAHVGHGHLFL